MYIHTQAVINLPIHVHLYNSYIILHSNGAVIFDKMINFCSNNAFNAKSLVTKLIADISSISANTLGL